MDLAIEEAHGGFQRNQREGPRRSDSYHSIQHGMGDGQIAFSVYHWD